MYLRATSFPSGRVFLSFFLGAGLRGIGGGRCFFFVARLLTVLVSDWCSAFLTGFLAVFQLAWACLSDLGQFGFQSVFSRRTSPSPCGVFVKAEYKIYITTRRGICTDSS